MHDCRNLSRYLWHVFIYIELTQMPELQCLIITLPETVYIILLIILRLPHLEDIAFRHVSVSALSWQLRG